MSKSYEKILSVVSLIPSSCVASYGQIADLSGMPNCSRLVSKALKSSKNKSLPWHRVVNSQGKIAFKASDPNFRLQLSLLREEGIEIKNNNKVNLEKHRWQPSLETMLFELSF